MDTIEAEVQTLAALRAEQSLARFEQRQQLAAVQQPSEDQSLLATISRIASDPNADIEKLTKVMDLYERVKSGRARAAYIAAFAEMQPELPTIGETGKIEIKNKEGNVIQSTSYAKQADIVEAVRPVLGKHGFALSHRTAQTPEGKITVTGILGHKEGHCEETTIVLLHDSTGSKNAVQAVGSTISYGIRYTTRLLLNIASRAPIDGDDDGVASGAPDVITDEQADEIRDLLTKTGADLDRFLQFAEAPSVSDISAKHYPKAIGLLREKLRRRPRQ